MSLRDQLVAKGLVSKKKAKRVNRELKEARKADQGAKRRKSALAREAQQAREAEAEARLARRREERERTEAQREAIERRLRIKNLISGNSQRPGAGQPFWHRSIDGRYLLRMAVSSGTALQLRRGEAAIAALPRPGDWMDYVIIPRHAAVRLEAFAPEHLVFFNHDAVGIAEPDAAPLVRQWEPSLQARRARPEDLDRWRQAVASGASASGAAP